MIRKLRIKFIALAMLSVLIVLAVILGTINVLNYREVVRDADSILEMLEENGGAFPGFGPGGEMRPVPDGTDPALSGEPDPAAADKQMHGEEGMFSAETPFESRYFIVKVSESGYEVDPSAANVPADDDEDNDSDDDIEYDDDDNDIGSDDDDVYTYDLSRIAAVDEDDAKEFADKALSSGNESGFTGSYRYTIDEDDGETAIYFLDCSRTLDNFRSFLYASLSVGLAGLVLVLILVYFLSGIVIRPVAESYEKQKRFITDAGHEIKTPLTIIRADAEVMELQGESNEWIEDIKLQTSRLSDLTEELVYLSRMEEGNASGRPKASFDFTKTVSETAGSFESRARLEGKDFAFEVADEMTMTGYEEEIKKLCSILLDNAFKYSGDAGAVRLSAVRSGRSITLSVNNTAENIDSDDIPHLFDRFYRSDKSRNSETGGHGIGLSIAQAIVNNHGGKISAQSKDGRSLTVTAVLPG
jgi:two-component system sensor histidine kinase CiaH